MDIIVNITLVVSAVIGMLLISEKNRLGFIAFFVTETSMIIIGVKSNNYGLVVTAVLYFILNVYSYRKWGQ